MAATAETPVQAVSVFQEFRAMFYVLGPSESSFRSVKEVPDYVDKATPLFITLILLEIIIKWVQKRHFLFLHSDDITSLSAGILSRIPDAISRSVEISAYVYVWNNYRMMELPWDSSWTWYLTFIGVDFGYYWFHRMAHESSESIEDSRFAIFSQGSIVQGTYGQFEISSYLERNYEETVYFWLFIPLWLSSCALQFAIFPRSLYISVLINQICIFNIAILEAAINSQFCFFDLN